MPGSKDVAVRGRSSELKLAPAEVSYLLEDGNQEMTVRVPFLDYLVDDISLREMLGERGEDLVTGLCRAWQPEATTSTVEALTGGGGGELAAVEMLVCRVCGDPDGGALLADVEVAVNRVVWRNWKWTDYAGAEPVPGLPALTFERQAYMTVVGHAAAGVAALPYDEKSNKPRRFLWPWQWGWRMPKSE